MVASDADPVCLMGAPAPSEGEPGVKISHLLGYCPSAHEGPAQHREVAAHS